MGAQNDTNYLYLVFMTGNQNNQFQILGRGMTVWFDKTGGKDKDFGIKFPLGKSDPGMKPPMNRNDMDNTSDVLHKLASDALSDGELEITGPGNIGKHTVYLVDEKGFFVNLTFNKNVFIYEMKIPLSGKVDNSFNLGVNDSTSIGVGFETPEFSFDKMTPPGNGNDMPDKGDGQHRPPPGMGPPGKNNSMPQQLNYWCIINLVPRKNMDKNK